jgi:hypothetical protein
LTNLNSQDVFLVKYSSDTSATLSFFKHFGGKDQDEPTDMDIWGSTIYIVGHTISAILSTNTFDIFVVSVNKNDGSTNWVRRLGTS